MTHSTIILLGLLVSKILVYPSVVSVYKRENVTYIKRRLGIAIVFSIVSDIIVIVGLLIK